QQRVAIARAVVKQPAILLADEPTGNLDPENSEEVVGVLDRVNRTSTTLVMATHDNSLVDRLQRRVIEMSDGRLVRDSTGGYRSEATSRRSGARRLDAVAEQDGHDSHDAHDDPSALDGTTTAIPGARATRRGRDITGAAS
ncbi:MAG TPA: cell division ATP-binding protein FtsE, partial [Dermacoccus sp.]|nr:cell division ATP-binding protein FtsE [Dermacoccus sp.]